MASGRRPVTMRRADSGTAIVRSPAPAFKAPRPARIAAPVMPRLPATIRTCPFLPLLESFGRRGIMRWMLFRFINRHGDRIIAAMGKGNGHPPCQFRKTFRENDFRFPIGTVADLDIAMQQSRFSNGFPDSLFSRKPHREMLRRILPRTAVNHFLRREHTL